MRLIKNNPVVVLTTVVIFLALCIFGYFVILNFPGKTSYQSDKFSTEIDQKDNAVKAELTSGGSQITFTSDYNFTLGENVKIDYEIIKDGRNQGLKETITLKNKSAPHEFIFDLQLKDVKNFVLAPTDRSWRFYNNSDKEVFYIPAGFMVDAKGARSEGVQITIAQNGADYLLKVTADSEWLNDSSRAYPVEIDPSVIVSDGLTETGIANPPQEPPTPPPTPSIVPPQAHSAHVYLAQWEWACESADECYWRAPGGGNVGSLDLRTLPQMGKAGGTPQGYGIFTYKEQRTIPESLYLGTDLNRSLTLTEKTAIKISFGLAELTSNTVLDFLWDIFTKYTDPTGQTAPKPLTGKQGETVKLYLSGFSLIKEEPFTEEHRQRTIDVFKEDYKRNIKEGVPLETLQRWTGSTMKDLYGKMDDEIAEKILPLEHKANKWKEPHTTIKDDFDRTNADALGTATVASVSQGWSWTEVAGDMDILSNQAKVLEATNTSYSRADSDLSSADHYAQALFVSLVVGRRMGVAARFSAATGTFYFGVTDDEVDFDYWGISKFVTDPTPTETRGMVTNTTGYAAPVNNTLKLTVKGSSLEFFQDEVSKVTLTDSSITGNLRTGLFGRRNSGTGAIIFDNFVAADLALSVKIQGGTKLQGGTKIR